MEPIEGSETSAYNYQTPGKHPKEYIIDFTLTLHTDTNISDRICCTCMCTSLAQFAGCLLSIMQYVGLKLCSIDGFSL